MPANDLMLVNSTQLDADLADVADAIRAKSGGSSQLVFPSGYISEIESIQTGGEVNPVAEEKDVIFIDYDGTIRYSYTAYEFSQLSALPENPIHSGLTARGWNWTLSDAKAYVALYKKLVIGQMYITSDGNTKIHILIYEGRLSPYLGLGVDGTVEVDWGDNTTHSTMTGSDVNTSQFIQHFYSSPGRYTISLDINGTAQFNSAYNTKPVLLTQIGPVIASETLSVSSQYYGSIEVIEIGNGITTISKNAFRQFYNLKYIILGNVNTLIESAFYGCVSLNTFIFNDNMVSVGEQILNTCRCKYISTPKAFNFIGKYFCKGNQPLRLLNISDNVQTIGQGAMSECRSITSITIPLSVNRILPNAFEYLLSLGELHFTSNSPPSVDNSNAWQSMPTDCIIYVPTGSLASYTSATNYPDPSVYTYMEE